MSKQVSVLFGVAPDKAGIVTTPLSWTRKRSCVPLAFVTTKPLPVGTVDEISAAMDTATWVEKAIHRAITMRLRGKG
jgi:hypothetical protein